MILPNGKSLTAQLWDAHKTLDEVKQHLQGVTDGAVDRLKAAKLLGEAQRAIRDLASVTAWISADLDHKDWHE